MPNNNVINFFQIGAIATIELNNPEQHNVLTKSAIQNFCHCLDMVATDSTIKVLVIRAVGNKTFCAGASLDEIGAGQLSAAEFAELPNKISAITIPTICALNGDVFGGGVELGICCDFRIGVKGMKLKIPAARLGVKYPAKGVRRYQQVLGMNTAKRLLMRCESLNASQLLEYGYLTQLVGFEQLSDSVDLLCDELLALDSDALMAIKDAFEFV